MLSGLLFSIGLRTALERLKEKIVQPVEDADETLYQQWLIAYLDDTTVRTSKSRSEIIAAWQEVEATLSTPTGLRLHETKTTVVPAQEALCVNGLNILGSHVGPLSTTTAHIEKVLQRHLERIASFKDCSANARIRIFDVCLQHEVMLHLRTLDPAVVSTPDLQFLCQRTDTERYRWYLQVACITSADVTDSGRLNIQLPRRFGGGGLPLVDDVASIASHASATTAWGLLAHREFRNAPSVTYDYCKAHMIRPGCV